MSKKYLDEVKNAGEDRLSFSLYSIQVKSTCSTGRPGSDKVLQYYLLKLSGSILPSLAASHVTRIDLNKNLGEGVGPKSCQDLSIETSYRRARSCYER